MQKCVSFNFIGKHCFVGPAVLNHVCTLKVEGIDGKYDIVAGFLTENRPLYMFDYVPCV